MAFLERFGLTSREQRLLNILAIVVGVVAFIGVPLGMSTWVSSKRSENKELKEAIDGVQSARAQVALRKSTKDAVAQRYAKKAPELAGWLEQTARKQKLDVSDTTDRPPVPIGKKYVERHTIMHIKKANLLALVRFMEGIEQSGSPMVITRFNMRKRTEADSYDCEIGVSAYDRLEPKAAEPKPGEPKPGDKK